MGDADQLGPRGTPCFDATAVRGRTVNAALEPPWYDALINKWPDFLVTFLGVLLAALLALWIERGVAYWQPRPLKRPRRLTSWRASTSLPPTALTQEACNAAR